MKHKYLDLALEKLRNEYGVDGLRDVILNRPKRLCLYLDITENEKPLLNVVTGNLSDIGFEDKPSIFLEEIFNCFDKNNKYGSVGGKEEYYWSIYNKVYDFTVESNVSFPMITENGRYWIRYNAIPIKEKENMMTVFITDVTEFLNEEEKLFDKTHRDALTTVFNNYTLDYHYGVRYQHEDFHVLYLDLDNFKDVNDKLGHQYGNEYLQDFAKILLSYEDNYDRFYRIGGDEFVGLFFRPTQEILEIASSIISRTKELSIKKNSLDTSVSIGVIQATTREDVIKKADKLLYEAKSSGKNKYVFGVE